MAHKWAGWLHNPCRLGGPHGFRAGAESEVAHKWAKWLHNPCRPRGPHRFGAGGQNQKWPTSGPGGYMTLAAWRGPHRFKVGSTIRRGPQMGQVAT